MKLGIIGLGNMASAILGGIIKEKIVPVKQIIGADVSEEGRAKAKKQFKICVTEDNKEVVEKAELIILAVKPQFYKEVIREIRDLVREDQIVVTIAPGKTLAWLTD